MRAYDHKKLEKKWQDEWDRKQVYQAKDFSKKPKYYSLIEFPYPSGDGLHVGHPRPYIGMDVISRYKRIKGFNVLYPIGWDAFGLPTENYAIKTGQDPRVVTKKNSDTFRRQIKSLGISFDWSREINTTDPKYYKWTQWIFLQFLKRGLAYKAKMAINWCPKDKIGLANEEVINGACERCGTLVEKREKEQWMLAITKYADRLDKDLDTVDYLPQIKLAQRNWIGKSEGAEIKFAASKGESIKIFTTRPETIFGATFVALAGEKDKFTGRYVTNPATKEKIPVWQAEYVMGDVGTGAIMGVPAHDERDFEFAKKHNIPIKQVIEPMYIQDYEPGKYQEKKPIVPRNAIIAIVKHWSEEKYITLKWKKVAWHTWVTGGIEEGQTAGAAAIAEIKEETGYLHPKFVQELGVVHGLFYHVPKGENRLVHGHIVYFKLENGEKEKVREEESSIHDLEWMTMDEIKKVLTAQTHQYALGLFENKFNVYTGKGFLKNSGKFTGLDSEKAKREIIKFVGGKAKTTFKLRDWIFSRQRYWGEPIPVVDCGKCGLVPVPEKDLPVELPKLRGEIKNYHPTDTGESPLANISKWVNVKCPKCKGKARRETDTMPNWAGSSWYYLRYTDPKNTKTFADKKNLKYWLGSDPSGGGVNWYNGGNEHTTLHLLYSRFWHKFLFDLKLVPTSEPYKKRTTHGIILASGGEKMSKSRGNVVNPDDIVGRYGADTLRVYEMFMGPFDQAIAWSEEAIIGPRRFLERVWKVGQKVASLDSSSKDIVSIPFLDKTIKKVSEDIESMHFNTAISAMMISVNHMDSAIARGLAVKKEDYKKFLQILSPFAPHITEELWKNLGENKSINLSTWPGWRSDLLLNEEVTIIVQVNGKMRGQFKSAADITEAEARERAENLPEVKKWIEGKEKKFIVVPGKVVNIVI